MECDEVKPFKTCQCPIRRVAIDRAVQSARSAAAE